MRAIEFSCDPIKSGVGPLTTFLGTDAPILALYG
jgi:hypothetical protein